MCCRYYVNAGTYTEVGELLDTGTAAKAVLGSGPASGAETYADRESSLPGCFVQSPLRPDIAAPGQKPSRPDAAAPGQKPLQSGADPFRPRDIHPSDTAPILLGEDGRLVLAGMRWGLPGQGEARGKLLINARAETLTERRTFAPLAQNFRCIVPASLFYEWNPKKEKIRFANRDNSLLCMAGIYAPGPDGARFVVITTEANASMRPVHDRMPLIFSKEQAADWILRPEETEKFLAQGSPMLKRSQEYEQLSFF